MKKMIYLDNAATTPVDPRVVAKMVPYLYERFGNASSRTHVYGWGADEAIEIAREEVAALIGCEPAEVVWTSGATEANNLALRGIVQQALRTRGRAHVVSVKTEHASVLETLRALVSDGADVTLLDVDAKGLLNPDVVAAALRADTVLVSVMLVNNEIGVIQDIAAIGAICRAHGVWLHVDAAQAVGKVAIDLAELPVDFMSFSAHKIHGPQGIGVLFVRSGLAAHLAPQLFGGGQEQGLRAGTLPLHQIVGLGEAFHLARRGMAADNDRIRWLRDRLWAGLAQLDGVFVNGGMEQRIPHNLNVGFKGVDGQALIERLSLQLALSSGSACASSHLAPSHVLSALGRSDVEAIGSLRFSLGRYTTEEEIDTAIDWVAGEVAALRGAAPEPLMLVSNSESPVANAAMLGDEEDCPMKRMRRRMRRSTATESVPESRIPATTTVA